MKKLGKLKLHNSVVMSDSELKHIVGGTTQPGGTGTPANCSTSCNNGPSISCTTYSSCTAVAGKSVTCTDAKGDSITVKCSKSTDE